MKVLLTVCSGSDAGRKKQLRSGQSLTVGRTEMAEFAIAHDLAMSGVHFSVSCSRSSCRIKDLGSSAGTSVNGAPITDTELADGDEILAGNTRLSVSLSGVPVAAAEPPPEPSEPAPTPVGVAELAGKSEIHSGRPYVEAFRDDDPGVRREALTCAVWTRQDWLLGFCRNACRQASDDVWDLVQLLAILGDDSDLQLMLAVGKNPTLKSRRFSVLATYGHPAVVNRLIDATRDHDPNVAIAAGKAYTKMLGVDLATQTRVELPPEDETPTDDFDSEFADQDYLPDPVKAQQYWESVHQQFAHCKRLRRGFDVGDQNAMAAFNRLDMESRWEIMLREQYSGRQSFRLADIFRFGL